MISGASALNRVTVARRPAGGTPIFAARPSMGKTSLVLNMAQHVGTKTEMSVGVFSLELARLYAGRSNDGPSRAP